MTKTVQTRDIFRRIGDSDDYVTYKVWINIEDGFVTDSYVLTESGIEDFQLTKEEKDYAVNNLDVDVYD